ncbi:hypothetical protein ACFL0V_04625 [Nanoarchaeota archaeon]
MELADFKSIIKGYARRWANRPADIEDLEQIGRLVVWKVTTKDPAAVVPYVYFFLIF